MRWVASQRAELLLDVDKGTESDFAYQLNMDIWVPDFTPDQAISLELNGHTFDRQAISPGLHTIKYRIPARHVLAGINRFSLHFTQAQRPNEADHRTLAVVVSAVKLEKIELEQ